MSKNWSERAGLLVPLALAAALGFYRIGAQSLWLDEAFSVTLARLHWAQFRGVLTTAEVNMAPYYLLLHGWVRLGTSEFAVRALSAIFVAATVLPLYDLGRRLFDRPTAVTASLLFAMNAFVIANGAQEARGYGLAVLLATTSSALFIRALDRPRLGTWAAYVITGALTMYAHFFGALVLVAQLGSGLLLPARTGRRREVLLAGAAIALLLSPLVYPIVAGGHLGWVQRPRGGMLVEIFGDLAGRGGRSLAVAYAVLCGVALTTSRRTQPPGTGRSARWSYLFVLAWFVVPVLGSFIFSVVVKPVLVTRYLIIAAPALALLAAAGVSSVRPAQLRAAVLIAVVALEVRGLARWYTGRYPKEAWRTATVALLASAHPGDVVAFEPAYVRLPFEYYLERRPSGAVPQPLFPTAPWGHAGPVSREFSDTLDNWLAQHPPPASRVWVVQRDLPRLNASQPRWYPAVLERRSCRVAERFYTRVRVLLYEPAPCPAQAGRTP
jgi:mannosyltransferase